MKNSSGNKDTDDPPFKDFPYNNGPSHSGQY